MSVTLFETPRLTARRLTADDVDALYEVYGDADAMNWVGDGQPITREQCVQWVDVTLNNYARRGYGMATLVERSTGTVVGFIGLVHPGGKEEAELKYALRRTYWGQGLATEAARAILDYGQWVFGLTHVIATVYPDNAASHRVLLKAGMEKQELRPNDDGSFTQMFVWRAAPIE